jgi:hypothetical protein
MRLPIAHAGAMATLAVMMLVGLLELVGRLVGAAGSGAALLRGAKIAWPATAVLCLLPLTLRSPEVLGGNLGAVVGCVALLMLTWRVDRESPTGLPLVASPIRGRFGLWELSLLAIPVAATILFLQIGARSEGHMQNDSAYYFGVARHMALTKRFEEPIVWHFVQAPATLVHPPFDYWGGLTSVVLAPILALFGPTQHTAFIAMGAISGLTTVAFWYLACVALPIRYPAVQLLAVVAFAIARSARQYRFDTESLPLYHLLIVIGLIGLATARYRLAVVTAFLAALCRIDGVILFASTLLFAVVRLRRSPIDLRRVLLLAGGLVAAFMARNLWSFHTLLPPGSSAAATMTSQAALYELHRAPGSRWDAVVRLFQFSYLAARFDILVDRLLQMNLLPAQQLWYALTIGGFAFVQRRPARALVPAVALFMAYVFVWGSGGMFHQWRTVSALLPLLVLGAALGVGVGFDGIVALRRRARRHRRALALGATMLVFLLGYPVATRIEVGRYEQRERGASWAKEVDLSRLDATLAGAPVASSEPWIVMAQTRSPVVSLPTDGPRSVVEVLRRYHIQWIVLADDRSIWKGLFNGLAKGTGKGDFDGLSLERIDAPGTLEVFRVRWR